ncbi:P-loop containing nucleoside triphosphate hydrolase protein [Tribonema minus]|uniref:P-loop containing nucleoside triphosphate hydrolase protein n=1 Tax=Tribonema minus TaxID=303371 RepID=A0A835Z5S7_9STRA|nr:P-loop containing nucleoside triphosphate hydrolase protein [Tribonema minus]
MGDAILSDSFAEVMPLEDTEGSQVNFMGQDSAAAQLACATDDSDEHLMQDSPADLAHMEDLARPLVELADKLRGRGLEKDVAIPQIAVVGDQSSGKSSVLEAISGIPFPRGSGLVTRCATELRMQSAERFLARAYTTAARDAVATLTTVAAVECAIAQLTEELCSEQGFSAESIVIQLAAPNIPNLTVIDLPGIVRTTTAGQSRSVMQQVDGLLRSYMKQPRTIMLVLVPSNQDVATVGGLELAAEHDPEGVRTMGVLTKPDLINPGAEREAVAVLLNETKPLKLGYVMVKNRSHRDIANDMSLANAHAAEVAYFDEHCLFGALDRALFTVANLKQRLSALLVARIRAELPRMRAEIDEKLAAARADLVRLGPGFERCSPEEKAAAMVERINAYSACVAGSANGRYSEWLASAFDGGDDDGGDDVDPDFNFQEDDDDDGGGGEGGGAGAGRMYTDVYAAFTAFKRAVAATRPPDDADAVAAIRAEQQRFKGEELPGFLSFAFFRHKAAQIMAAWHAPADTLAQRVLGVLPTGSTAAAAAHAARLPALREALVRASAEAAEESMQRASDRIRLIWEHERSQPLTLDDRFMEVQCSSAHPSSGASCEHSPLRADPEIRPGACCRRRAQGINARRVQHIKSTLPRGAADAAAMDAWVERHMAFGTDGSDALAARDMLDFLAAYWDVASRRYTDAVCRAVQAEMLAAFGAALEARLGALRVDAAAAERCLAEDPLVRSQRAALQRKAERLAEAKTVVAACLG